MSRTPASSIRAQGMAKELANRAAQLGGEEAAALAVFGQFLVGDGQRLSALVADMPAEPRAVWQAALARGDDRPSRELGEEFRREGLARLIETEQQPVLAEGYLFELFQRALDAGQRRRRGMYYTPRPLVDLVLRRVRDAIDEHFPGRPRLHVVDPACGYGAFLLPAAELFPEAAITGIEVCRITWAVAHLLAVCLRPGPAATRQLVLTNPLEAGEALAPLILGSRGDWLPVIVGNPPWSNFGRQNRSAWMQGLLADYRAGLSERKVNLSDDAIKFLRWGQYWVQQRGAGVLALVTPNTWLGGLTHRRMRQSLLETFDAVQVFDLHGESASAGGDDDGDDDENVFGVRSGVAIAILVRRQRRREEPPTARVRHLEIRGSRQHKLAWLAGSLPDAGSPLAPAGPDWLLRPATCQPSTSDYDAWWPLDRIFREYTSGVQTKNDRVFVGFTRDELTRQVKQWLALHSHPARFDPDCIRPYLLAPLDRRWVYYDPRLLGRARHRVMRHMLRPNLGLVFMRQSTTAGQYDHLLAVDCLVSDRVFYSRHGAPFLAPLWLEGESNFQTAWLLSMSAATDSSPDPAAIFHYLYAIGWSPTYRERHGEPLRRGFPRFPLPPHADAFARLADLGSRLVALHLGRFAPTTSVIVSAAPQPFRVGGYDVLRRWQAPRRGRILADHELSMPPQIAAIGRETRALMATIDDVARTSLGEESIASNGT